MGKPVLNERGAALIVAIMLLMVLTILMAVLNHTTLFEMVSSRTYQESQRAFYAADAGTRHALRWLAEQESPPESMSNPPGWFHDGTVALKDATWCPWETVDNFHFRYYIEHLKDAPNYNMSGTIGKDSKGPKSIQHYYRITAQGANSTYLVRRQVQIVTTAFW